jgi:hypothetical protein
MKGAIFGVVTPRISEKCSCFGGICRLCLHGQRVSLARTQQEEGGTLFPYKIHSNVIFLSDLFLQHYPAKVSVDFSFMSCALHDPLILSDLIILITDINIKFAVYR